MLYCSYFRMEMNAYEMVIRGKAETENASCDKERKSNKPYIGNIFVDFHYSYKDSHLDLSFLYFVLHEMEACLHKTTVLMLCLILRWK